MGGVEVMVPRTRELMLITHLARFNELSTHSHHASNLFDACQLSMTSVDVYSIRSMLTVFDLTYAHKIPQRLLTT